MVGFIPIPLAGDDDAYLMVGGTAFEGIVNGTKAAIAVDFKDADDFTFKVFRNPGGWVGDAFLDENFLVIFFDGGGRKTGLFGDIGDGDPLEIGRAHV